MKTYVKKDLIRLVSQKTGYPHEQVAAAVDAIFSVLRNALAEADPAVRIEIRGFGALGVKKAGPKPKARNPRTNELFYVHPHRKAFFKPGKRLMASLHTPLEQPQLTTE